MPVLGFKPPKAKPRLESAEEADFLRDLKKFKVPLKVRKLNGIGNRSWPDRMVLGPEGFLCLIEFKRKKLGKLSEGQKELFSELAALGHVVHVFDDGHAAAEFLRGMLIKHGVLDGP